MNKEEQKKCPLCAEEMDWTDQQLKPCKCGYEVCVWCWHHIMEMAEKDETEGRCPACRTPYDKERIVGMEANCHRVVSTKKDKKNKPQKAKPKVPEVTRDLTGVRVIQRKMAYVIGLPLSLADENLLQRKEFFGQYGKVSKVSLSRTAGGAIQQFVNRTCSVYVTYSKEEEAIRCIQSIHGFVLEGRFLRASFGTAKYCHAWLRNLPCTNAACLYLHSIGAEEDSFSKDEEAAVHTRNRVHQIVGATHNMQRRLGNVLPPPLDDPLHGNGVATDSAIVGSTLKDTAHVALISNGHLNSSLSSKDRAHIKIPNKTFVDIVGGSSCVSERDSRVGEDGKILDLCSEFSSVAIKEANPLDTDYCNSLFKKASSSCHLPIELPRDKDSQEYFAKPFRESSKFSVFERPYFPLSNACGKGHSFLMSDSERQVLPGSCSEVQKDFRSLDEQRSKCSDSLVQGTSVLSSSYPIRVPDHCNDHAQQRKETHIFSGCNMERSTVHNHVDEAFVPFTYANSAMIDGYNERNIKSSTKVDRNLRPSNSFSNVEIVEHLRRLDDDDIVVDNDTSALDVVESSIISNILSMDFDSCGDSLTSSQSLTELMDGVGRQRGSWNFRNSEESRFSFAERVNPVNQEPHVDSSFNSIGQASRKYSPLPDSIENEEHYSWAPQTNVSRAQSLIPPGFSVPSREPPPGFPPRERLSGNHLVKISSLPNDQFLLGSTTNITNNRDFNFVDPTVVVVGKGKSTNTMTSKSIFEARCDPTPQTYEDEARLRLLMQQSASVTDEDPLFPKTFVQEAPTAHQDLISLGQMGNGFYPTGDASGLTSMLMDPHHSYEPSPVPQLFQQKYKGHVSNSYGGVDLDEVRLRNEMGMGEIQRNESLGLNKIFPGYGGGLVLQVPSMGDALNRVYGF